MKKTNIWLVITWGMSSVFWSLNAVCEIVSTSYPATLTHLILIVSAAVGSTVTFIVTIKDYCSSRNT